MRFDVRTQADVQALRDVHETGAVTTHCGLMQDRTWSWKLTQRTADELGERRYVGRRIEGTHGWFVFSFEEAGTAGKRT